MAWDKGGVGSDESLLLLSLLAGAVSIDWRARHELTMFPIVLCALAGGLEGGEANSDACNRVTGGGCDESHESAEGINMVAMFVSSKLRDWSANREWVLGRICGRVAKCRYLGRMRHGEEREWKMRQEARFYEG